MLVAEAQLLLNRYQYNFNCVATQATHKFGSRACFILRAPVDTRLRMPNKWHTCKEGRATTKKDNGLLVFSELPSLPSAGSRPGYFHSSLGCKPKSFIRVSLGWFDYSKKCEGGQSNFGLFAS
jgi:hypothetical protein